MSCWVLKAEVYQPRWNHCCPSLNYCIQPLFTCKLCPASRQHGTHKWGRRSMNGSTGSLAPVVVLKSYPDWRPSVWYYLSIGNSLIQLHSRLLQLCCYQTRDDKWCCHWVPAEAPRRVAHQDAKNYPHDRTVYIIFQDKNGRRKIWPHYYEDMQQSQLLYQLPRL